MIREYGRIVVTTTGSGGSAFTRNRVEENYRATKERAFPFWPGEPEMIFDEPIRLTPLVTVLGSGWHADVPEEYVL